VFLLDLLASIAFYPPMAGQDRSQKQTSKEPQESAKETVSVYFKCPSGLLKEFEDVAKIAGFMSKEEAIRQAMREFRSNYTPDHYKASQVTGAQIATMAEMYEKYPNVQSLIVALRSQIAGLP
jgi:metal-responsive CopG/Arc/MetJ family transcriptional regulator